MSADNGIYIVKFPEGFMIGHAQAIENIDWYLSNNDIDGYKQWCEQVFGKNRIYYTKETAILKAYELASQYTMLEYGVSYIGEYPSFLE